MLTVQQAILPLCAARCGRKLRRFSGVTVHETGNTAASADAKNHMRYMTQNGGSSKEVSYHYVVDETEAWHLVPDDEVAWHAGDGAAGRGNNETLAVELCVNEGADFAKTVENAARLIGAIFHEKGLRSAEGMVYEHHDFSPWGKNCPARLRAGQAGGMAHLRAAVQAALNELWNTGAQTAEAATTPARQEDTNPAAPLWKVQAGAFAGRESADALAEKMTRAGFACFVVRA